MYTTDVGQLVVEKQTPNDLLIDITVRRLL